RPELPFPEVRRFAKAVAQEVERRIADQRVATTTWKVADRKGVFVDFGQNARDRTIAAAYSIRPTPDARASAPLRWDEVTEADPAAFTLETMRDRVAAVGDLTADIWRRRCSLVSRFAAHDPRLGRALGARRANVVLPQLLRHVRTQQARVQRDEDEREADPGQDQVCEPGAATAAEGAGRRVERLAVAGDRRPAELEADEIGEHEREPDRRRGDGQQDEGEHAAVEERPGSQCGRHAQR